MDPIASDPEVSVVPEPTELALSDLPTPEGSARVANPPGFDHVLGDGRAWRLPNFIPVRDVVWDELHDQGTLSGQFEKDDVLLAVTKLVVANYDLQPEFVAWLVTWTAPQVLADAVNWALYGHPKEVRGYSDWVASSLLANGIEPAIVPPMHLREVLDQLVATSRAVPVDQFTSAGRAMAKRTMLLETMAESEKLAQETAGSLPTGHSEPQTFARPGNAGG